MGKNLVKRGIIFDIEKKESEVYEKYWSLSNKKIDIVYEKKIGKSFMKMKRGNVKEKRIEEERCIERRFMKFKKKWWR